MSISSDFLFDTAYAVVAIFAPYKTQPPHVSNFLLSVVLLASVELLISMIVMLKLNMSDFLFDSRICSCRVTNQLRYWLVVFQYCYKLAMCPIQ